MVFGFRGTPRTASPEMFQQSGFSRKYNPFAADMWAFAITVIEALLGAYLLDMVRR